jgi:hypothetical protein
MTNEVVRSVIPTDVLKCLAKDRNALLYINQIFEDVIHLSQNYINNNNNNAFNKVPG